MFAEHQPFNHPRRAPLPLSTSTLVHRHRLMGEPQQHRAALRGAQLSAWKSPQQPQPSPSQWHGHMGRGQSQAPALLPRAPGRGISGRAAACHLAAGLQHWAASSGLKKKERTNMRAQYGHFMCVGKGWWSSFNTPAVSTGEHSSPTATLVLNPLHIRKSQLNPYCPLSPLLPSPELLTREQPQTPLS